MHPYKNSNPKSDAFSSTKAQSSVLTRNTQKCFFGIGIYLDASTWMIFLFPSRMKLFKVHVHRLNLVFWRQKHNSASTRITIFFTVKCCANVRSWTWTSRLNVDKNLSLHFLSYCTHALSFSRYRWPCVILPVADKWRQFQCPSKTSIAGILILENL